MHFHCAIKTLIKWVQSPCNWIIAPFKIKCVNSYFSWSRWTIKRYQPSSANTLAHRLHSNTWGSKWCGQTPSRQQYGHHILRKKKPEYQKHFLSTDLNDETFTDRSRMNQHNNTGCTAPSHARRSVIKYCVQWNHLESFKDQNKIITC